MEQLSHARRRQASRSLPHVEERKKTREEKRGGNGKEEKKKEGKKEGSAVEVIAWQREIGKNVERNTTMERKTAARPRGRTKEKTRVLWRGEDDGRKAKEDREDERQLREDGERKAREDETRERRQRQKGRKVRVREEC